MSAMPPKNFTKNTRLESVDQNTNTLKLRKHIVIKKLKIF